MVFMLSLGITQGRYAAAVIEVCMHLSVNESLYLLQHLLYRNALGI